MEKLYSNIVITIQRHMCIGESVDSLCRDDTDTPIA